MHVLIIAPNSMLIVLYTHTLKKYTHTHTYTHRNNMYFICLFHVLPHVFASRKGERERDTQPRRAIGVRTIKGCIE